MLYSTLYRLSSRMAVAAMVAGSQGVAREDLTAAAVASALLSSSPVLSKFIYGDPIVRIDD